MCSLLLIFIKRRATNDALQQLYTFSFNFKKCTFQKFLFSLKCNFHKKFLKGVLWLFFTYVHTFVLVLFNFSGFSNLLLISLKVSIFQIFTHASVSTNAAKILISNLNCGHTIFSSFENLILKQIFTSKQLLFIVRIHLIIKFTLSALVLVVITFCVNFVSQYLV